MPPAAAETGPLLALVDGGATGTRLRLCDADGRRLGEGTGGPSSLTLGVGQALDSVAAAFRAARTEAGLDAADHRRLRLAAGLAGSRSAPEVAAFRAGDPIGCEEILVVTDGFASLLGAHDGAPGTVLAVGTGVTAYSLSPAGAVAQTSGWGFPMGDEGGGAWIGHRALQAYTHYLDGRGGTEGRLFAALAAETGGHFDAIQVWARGASATRYATLAPLVVDAAGEGDPLAATILRDAAGELDRVIAAVDPPGSTLPIALLGGLAPTFASRLSAGVRRRLVTPRGGPIDGLLRLLRHPELAEARS